MRYEKSIHVDRTKCIYCGACVGVCPKLAMRLKDVVIVNDRERCNRCGICIKACPVGAISLV